MATKMRYYDTVAINKTDSHYNFIIGERSNGKTTALLRDIISMFYQTGQKGAIVRQMEEDIKGHKGASLFSGVIAGNMVSELTDGEYHGIVFRNRAYYLTKIDDEGKQIAMKEPFAHIFAVSQSIHYKSNSYPGIGIIMFDEFMRADHVYLQDEVLMFLNLVSTLVRDKADAKIYLIANTVSWNCPYFKKFGLRDISKMRPGDLAKFEYKKKRATGVDIIMKVAVEYCENTASYGGKPSDVYFAIDDERTNMITDGDFAIPTYPQCPHHFKKADVRMVYWILTGDEVLRARLIKVDRQMFVFVDTVDQVVFEGIADERRDIFYSLAFTGRRNHYTCPQRPYQDPRTHYLANAFATNRLFFDSNDTGENLMYYAGESHKWSVMTLGS